MFPIFKSPPFSIFPYPSAVFFLNFEFCRTGLTFCFIFPVPQTAAPLINGIEVR